MSNVNVASVDKKSIVDIAVSHHREGFGCSQALLLAFAPKFGLDNETALRISTGFAGGLARLGETCGAVTSALMIIGLKYGKTKPDDERAKEFTYYYAEEFYDGFRARNGSIFCRDLIGCELSTPEGLKFFREKKIMQTVCPKFVSDAAEILDKII